MLEMADLDKAIYGVILLVGYIGYIIVQHLF